MGHAVLRLPYLCEARNANKLWRHLAAWDSQKSCNVQKLYLCQSERAPWKQDGSMWGSTFLAANLAVRVANMDSLKSCSVQKLFCVSLCVLPGNKMGARGALLFLQPAWQFSCKDGDGHLDSSSYI